MMDPSIGSITNQFDPRMAALLGWVVLMTKIAVDWIKTAMTLPRWAPPGLAFVAAFCVLLLLMLALGIPMSVQLVAQAILSAMIATALAIAQTALQDRTKPSESLSETDMSRLTGHILSENERRIDAEKRAAAAEATLKARGV